MGPRLSKQKVSTLSISPLDHSPPADAYFEESVLAPTTIRPTPARTDSRISAASTDRSQSRFYPKQRRRRRTTTTVSNQTFLIPETIQEAKIGGGGTLRKAWSALFRPAAVRGKLSQTQVDSNDDVYIGQWSSLSDSTPWYRIPYGINDMDILDRRHFAMRTQLESLYTCDLKHSTTKKVLQIGAGNGLWCMEMAKIFPRAQVIGVEQFQVELTVDEKPPVNCSFLVFPNFRHPFPFPVNNFNYIHIQFIAGSVLASRLPSFFSHMYDLIEPGGYLEYWDSNMLHISPLRKCTLMLNKWVLEYCQASSHLISIYETMGSMLTDIGFEQIEVRRILAPTGSCAGQLGDVWMGIWLEHVEKLSPELSLGPSERLKWQEEWKDELECETGEWQIVLVRARKPLPRND